MAVLGLRFCARAFSSCGKRGPLFIAVRGPLTIAASLVAEQRLQMHRLSSCGSQAQLLRGTWDLPRPGLEPMSPALAGRFSTTAPPGKLLIPNFMPLLLSISLFGVEEKVWSSRLCVVCPHLMINLFLCHFASFIVANDKSWLTSSSPDIFIFSCSISSLGECFLMGVKM